MSRPALDPASPELRTRHLLVLPADVEPQDVEILATSRFPRAERLPAPGPASGRSRRPAEPLVETLRLSRLSSLEGPYAVARGTRTALGLPAGAGTAYLVHAPVERGDPPLPYGGDRDGLCRAFPDGLPVRDEQRTVAWLIDAARRLGGGVRIAGSSGPVLLLPDPAAAVDVTVWSDIWLEPEAGLAVVREAAPGAYLNLPSQDWGGPPRGTGESPVPGAEDLEPDERRALHAAADEQDVAALAGPATLEGYGVLVDLGLDGILALTVDGETDPPPAVAAVPWATRGAVAYAVRWEPFELEDLEAENPSTQHRVARRRATRHVLAVARAVHHAVGGEVTDTMGFVIDPQDL